MDYRVMGCMDAACGLGWRHLPAMFRAQLERHRPFDADREQRMRDDSIGTARVDVTVEQVAEAGRISHRPAFIDFADERLRFGSNQR
jgi:hypothetical protein